MKQGLAVLCLGLAACGVPSGGEATIDDAIYELRIVTGDHREAVQASFDLEEIQSFEATYEPDWGVAIDHARGLMVDCLGATDPDDEGQITVDAWLSTLRQRVANHVELTHDHWKFSECWNAEDDHHYEIVSGIDALEAALEGC